MHMSDEDSVEVAINSIRSEMEALKPTLEESQKEIIQTQPKENDDEKNVWSFHDEFISSVKKENDSDIEFQLYLGEAPIDRDRCAIQYWKRRPEIGLSRIALKYLNFTATSVPSERVFSKTGKILTNRRNRLKPKHVQSILFLRELLGLIIVYFL